MIILLGRWFTNTPIPQALGVSSTTPSTAATDQEALPIPVWAAWTVTGAPGTTTPDLSSAGGKLLGCSFVGLVFLWLFCLNYSDSNGDENRNGMGSRKELLSEGLICT